MGVIKFENTINRTEITKWYSIEGAPAIEHKTPRGTRSLLPVSARFIFVDGDVNDLCLVGKPVLQDGSVRDNTQKFPDIYIWNQQDWPEWLKRLRDLACAEFAADSKASA